MRTTGILILALSASLCASGCHLPSKAIRSDYSTYNQTIQYNQSQQMLLNLVRLKYRETPLFLKVGALSASYSYSMDGSANFAVGGRTKGYGVRAGAAYSTRPTITYTPLEGNTFVQQVLSEVETTEFILMIRSGWSIDKLCSIIVERIGDNHNDPDEPGYEQFKTVVEALDEAQGAGNLQIVSIAGEAILQVKSRRVALDSLEVGDELKTHSMPMSSFQLRSFLDIMFFLGKNTLVPEEHKEMVRESTPNGQLFIRATSDEPKDAMVAIRHHGYHFSIDNTDVNSKDTFALLKLLYQMRAGDVKSSAPILTLPVNF